MGGTLQVGLALAQYGRFAGPRSIGRISRAAEALGFDSLWVGDRLLVPLDPVDRYPGGDPIPPAYRTFLDPFAVLSVAATVTERVRLGTSTVNAPWYPPVLLARSLTTIDVLSGGRLDAGFGLGWSGDEYAALGVRWADRGERMESFLDALEAIWSGDPVEHKSAEVTIVPSHIGPKPVQRPRPPIYLGGFTPAALERAGRRADGWLAVPLPGPMFTELRQIMHDAAEKAGRDSRVLRIVQRVDTVRQAEAAAAAGVHEVLLDLQHTARDDDHLLELAAGFRSALS